MPGTVEWHTVSKRLEYMPDEIGKEQPETCPDTGFRRNICVRIVLCLASYHTYRTMPPLGIRDLTMPQVHLYVCLEDLTDGYSMAAFGMVFVLGSYVYNSIGSARRNAEMERDKKLGEILESRKKLGMDEDPVAFRKRRKADAAAAEGAGA